MSENASSWGRAQIGIQVEDRYFCVAGFQAFFDPCELPGVSFCLLVAVQLWIDALVAMPSMQSVCSVQFSPPV